MRNSTMTLISNERSISRDLRERLEFDCSVAHVEHKREQMKLMFGNTKLPAVVYKGTAYPEREL